MINILLDLDQTLISAEVLQEDEDDIDEEYDEEIYDIDEYKMKAINFDFENMDNYYVIFARPGLQKFLDFLFANFNVSVWTAASKDYAMFIIEKMILMNKPERKLDYVFCSYHCKITDKVKNGTKDLSILWDKYKLPGYNKNNTYILDDYDEVYETQPDNCIIAEPFYFTHDESEKDDFLPKLTRKLSKLKKRMSNNDGSVTKILNEDKI
jgi:TFIIF-interacting CTD phosphatase-like protein